IKSSANRVSQVHRNITRLVSCESRTIAGQMSILLGGTRFRASWTCRSMSLHKIDAQRSASVPERNTDQPSDGCPSVLRKQQPRFRRKLKVNGFCSERRKTERSAKQ